MLQVGTLGWVTDNAFTAAADFCVDCDATCQLLGLVLFKILPDPCRPE